ncbi:hypothetical protein BGZ72_010998 [Mortierella alpina]|nr:hypothetical protein BGZ72_010998 [Mortierella alpina]
MEPHPRRHTQQEPRHDQTFEQPPSSLQAMVDIGSIEHEKENIQPIKEGRSAQALARLFEARPGDRAQELALQRQQFLDELEQIEDLDDPMDVYARFVKWTMENYPQSAAQGHDSQLMPLLEQAYEMFKGDPIYRNDPRFIKLLMLYAEKVESPLDVFKYMEVNGLGSEIAVYYQEYADFLESREEYNKAKDIFLLGINRRARPLGRLKKQYEDFLLREQLYMEEQEKAANEDPTLASAHPPSGASNNTGAGSTVNRRVLGVRVTGSSSIPSNASSRGHVSIGSGGAPSSSANSHRSAAQSNNNRPNPKLTVFSDQSVRPPARPTSRDQENTPWSDLGTERIRRKENTREATSWKGAKLSAEDTFARRPQPRLQVYRDPEAYEPAQALVQPTESAGSEHGYDQQTELTEKPHIPMSDDKHMHQQAETTGQDQFDLSDRARQQQYKEARQDRIFPGPSALQARDHNPHRTDTANGKRECLMVDLKQLYVGDEEFSIEEIRSRLLRYSAAMPVNTKVAEPWKQHGSHKPILPIQEVLPRSPSEDERYSFGTKRRLTSSPTLNTKAASAVMNRLFSDRSKARRSMDSQYSTWSTEESQEVDHNDFDNHTMAYSIPSQPPAMISPSRREYLESTMQDDDEDEDDDDYHGFGDERNGRGGRTEEFFKRLEHDFPSTITQDIEKLKREREARASFGGRSDDFRHPLTNKLNSLSLGFHTLPTSGGLKGLDYLRGEPPILDFQTGKVLPREAPDLQGDILEKMEPILTCAIREGAKIFLFGSSYGAGIHDIHMNQGSLPQFANGVDQDGAILLQYPDGHWEPVFLAFASQRIPTDDRTGLPLDWSRSLVDILEPLHLP